MNTDIHRLLDEAFAGVEMTPDAQDLKEEMRANLVARVDELEAAGTAPSDAARRAIAELGDVRELLEAPDAASPAPRDDIAALHLRYRVRPKPAFVVRIVLYSAVFVGAAKFAAFAALGIQPLPLWVTISLIALAAVSGGLIVGDALRQETTTQHPMPPARAWGYATATAFGVLGLGLGGLIAAMAIDLWGIIPAGAALVASIVLFSFLGASQTNRDKVWVRRAHAAMPLNRFEEEPETAARFGIYTAAIWLVTFGVAIAVGLTAGWWWALLVLLGGFAVMMLVLARMMFPPRARDR